MLKSMKELTPRERFLRVFQGEAISPPLLDDGLRDGVLERWRTQGLPQNISPVEHFGLTTHDRIGPDITPRIANPTAVISLSARGYRAAFSPTRDRFPKDWPEIVRRLSTREHVIGLWATRGFFQALGVGGWATLEPVLYAVHDAPRKVAHRLQLYGEFCARMLDETLREVDPEFIYLGEPIADNHGPLISPDAFRKLALPAYEEVIAVARKHQRKRPGAANLLVSTYGNMAPLLPMLVEVGVNILWVSEIGELAEMDYGRLRARYGARLGLIGGIPMRLLTNGTDTEMEREVRALVPPLLTSGHYVPLASGRVREDTAWPRYVRYRQVLAELIAAHPE
jgi:hypothetical protein